MLISFVGGEGSGKSVQCAKLGEHLIGLGYNITRCADPHGEFRQMLLNPERREVCPRTEVFLFMAGRADIFHYKAIPALEKGGIVLYEQCIDASTVYQGHARGLGTEWVKKLNNFATKGIKPDITFLYDIEIGSRKVETGEFKEFDKIERLGAEFHQKVREGYLSLAKEEPERFRVIPFVEGDFDGMQAQAKKAVDDFIEHFAIRDKLLRQNP